MHIAIDARMITYDNMHGIARYVYNLILQLAEIDKENRYTILVCSHSPLRKELLPVERFEFLELTSKFISLREQIELPTVLKKIKADLFHSPSFVAPLFCPCPLVMTIHDLNHLVLPQYYTFIHQVYYKVFVKRCIEKSTWLLTVSHFSKSEILKYFKFPEHRIQVTYNGVNDTYKPLTTAVDLEKILDHYDLPSQYIFYVGNSKPHKNLLTLVRAYCQSNIELPLVMRAPVNVEALKIANTFNKKSRLYFTKFIPDDDLPIIMAGASLFVWPSTYEGFGLPPLEALACGTPVVVSNTTSIPEVLKDAGIYINPYDVNDIIRGLNEGLTNTGLRSKCLLKGVERVKQFTWKKMAIQTLKVYSSIYKETVAKI